jgi:hypothetical protein
MLLKREIDKSRRDTLLDLAYWLGSHVLTVSHLSAQGGCLDDFPRIILKIISRIPQ